jgi:hypothetical protein
MSAQTDHQDHTGGDVGKCQSLFREVNERIEEITAGLDADALLVLCECASVDCAQEIELSRNEYERLRRIPTHFAVLAGHDVPSAERVVERNERFITVETFGESGLAAIALDRRRARGGTDAVTAGEARSNWDEELR